MAKGVGCLSGEVGGVVEEVGWGKGRYDFVVAGWEDVGVDFETEFEREGEDREESGLTEGLIWCVVVVYLEVVGVEADVM